MVTSRAGGSGVDLGQVFVTISNGSKQCLLTWDNSFASAPSGSGVFSTANMYDFGADDFGIIVIEDADGSCTSGAPVINRGDKAVLTVNLSACFNGLTTRQDIDGMVVAEDGSPGVFLFRTPCVSSKTIVEFM
jgi:flagellin FlaB